MPSSASELEYPSKLTDDASLEAVFEGRFREHFVPLGITTIGELKRVPKGQLSHEQLFALNAWLLRCWWFR
ncbi:MAG: hypothetical protein KF708_24225 [Pirellulales bacterium]|nr:hypothetical protein [Pirellulales bacterium]